MSNPTTPFSWQMPTATDLVTDLPADFEVFGQAVATSMADLLGGTTGQVLSKTSNTDMDFTWVAPTTGDITGVTAGTGISGGGTSGDVTVTNSMATAMTTSGDLIQATGSGTFARLGTGTAGQYLTTNGTTNSWGTVSAGSMTLLSTTTLSGASTNITGISGSYTDLLVRFYGLSMSATARPVISPNSLTTVISYGGSGYSPTSGTSIPYGLDDTNFRPTQVTNMTASNTSNSFEFTITNYSGTTLANKQLIFDSAWDSASGMFVWSGTGKVETASAITSLLFETSSGTFNAGTVKVYGVN